VDLTVDASTRVRIYENAGALAEAAAQVVVSEARGAVAARGRVTIALAGGATPRATYMRLAQPPLSDAMPWGQAFVFFGDERCVPTDHPESNYRMAHETLLAKVAVPPAQIFPMPCVAEDPERGASEYARTLGGVFGTRRGALPRFDLVLLGMGVDGHTASLFPGSPALREIFRPVAAVHAAAAAIPQRITLTFPVFNAAAHVVFLVAGPEKAKAVKAVLRDRALLPAAIVRPTSGRLTWMLDRAAAALLG
jgi:6-phosphogluconolactonase